MKNVVITGASGNIGRYLSKYLSSYEDLNVFKPDLDVTVNANISKLLDYRPDYFINLAAISHPEEKDRQLVFDVNYRFVQKMLAALAVELPECRFLNAGSSHELWSRNPYAVSKICARAEIEDYRRKGMFCVQPYFYNAESEYRSEKFFTKKVVKGAVAIRRAINNGEDFEPLKLGNLNFYRDWSHAVDFATAIWAILNQDKIKSNNNIKDYTLCSGVAKTGYLFFKTVFDFLGMPAVAFPTDETTEFYFGAYKVAEMASDILSEPPFIFGDPSEIKNELGWGVQYSFEGVIRKLIGAEFMAYEEN